VGRLPPLRVPASESGSGAPTGAREVWLSAGGILYGKVLGATIDFLVVALLVFLFAKLVLKEEQVTKK